MNTNIFTQNETIMNAIANAASAEELQQIFANEGLEVSLEEIHSAIAMLAANEENGELTDSQLDNVAGGIALATCYMVLNCCMVAMAGKPLWLLATMRR